MLKANDVVVIYEDPITRKREEGKARLDSELRPDEGDGLSLWYVEFEDEPGHLFTRCILEECYD